MFVVWKLTGWPFDVIRRQKFRDLQVLLEAHELADFRPPPDLSWMREGA